MTEYQLPLQHGEPHGHSPPRSSTASPGWRSHGPSRPDKPPDRKGRTAHPPIPNGVLAPPLTCRPPAQRHTGAASGLPPLLYAQHVTRRIGRGGRSGETHTATPNLRDYDVPPASPVTVTRPDGTTEVRPAAKAKAAQPMAAPCLHTASVPAGRPTSG